MVKEPSRKSSTPYATTREIAGLAVAFIGVVIALFVVASWLLVDRVEIRLSRLVEYADGLYLSDPLIRTPFENGLALMTEGKWDEAVASFQQAEASTAGAQRMALKNYIGMCFVQQAKFREAESAFAPAGKLAAALGDSLGKAATLNNLAVALRAQGHYSQAESLFELALSVHERILGPGDPRTATSRGNLVRLYMEQGKYSLAEPLVRRELAAHEEASGPGNPAVATDLNELAGLYEAQARYAEAESLYRRALGMRVRAYGPEHPAVAQLLENMAALYGKMDRTEEAQRLAARAAKVRNRAREAQSPATRR
jgi:tetratricopeptide (TPR) repeat protein